MADTPQTWHYGLMAQWWAEFNHGGPEIAYFQQFIAGDGQPALDLACGTGRLLLPYLRAGLEVDGCDLSPDMLRYCREQAAREGLAPRLYAQAMHELALPRTYRTIIICGGFGLGGDRGRDFEALRRVYRHLAPGGRLVLDNEAPYADAGTWGCWPAAERRQLPQAGERRIGAGAAHAARGAGSAGAARDAGAAHRPVARRPPASRGGARPADDPVLQARAPPAAGGRGLRGRRGASRLHRRRANPG